MHDHGGAMAIKQSPPTTKQSSTTVSPPALYLNRLPTLEDCQRLSMRLNSALILGDIPGTMSTSESTDRVLDEVLDKEQRYEFTIDAWRAPGSTSASGGQLYHIIHRHDLVWQKRVAKRKDKEAHLLDLAPVHVEAQELLTALSWMHLPPHGEEWTLRCKFSVKRGPTMSQLIAMAGKNGMELAGAEADQASQGQGLGFMTLHIRRLPGSDHIADARHAAALRDATAFRAARASSQASLDALATEFWTLQHNTDFLVSMSPQGLDAALGQGAFSYPALMATIGPSLPKEVTSSLISEDKGDAKPGDASPKTAGDQPRRREGSGTQSLEDDTEVETSLGTWWGRDTVPRAGLEAARQLVHEEEDESGYRAFLAELGAENYHDREASIADERQALLELRAKASSQANRRGRAGLELSRRLQDSQFRSQKAPAWKRMHAKRQNLPVWSHRTQILEAIQNNQVVIISGETGSGKSMQVPQYVLEDALAAGRGAEVRIAVTQPRRISAVSLAKRVAQERCETVGDIVGYKVRTEASVTHRTRLTFCTAGVLLRKMIVDPDLQDVSHVFLDEVHERTTNTDFLLIALKQLMERRPDLKLILMSATVNAQDFSEYFNNCPHIAFPGRTFPVSGVYLEEFLKASDYQVHDVRQAIQAFTHLQQYQAAMAEQKASESSQQGTEAPRNAPGGGGRTNLTVGGTKRASTGEQVNDQAFGNWQKRDWHEGFKLMPEDFIACGSRVKKNLGRWTSAPYNKEDPFLVAAAVRHIHESYPEDGDGALLVILSGLDMITAVQALLTCGQGEYDRLQRGQPTKMYTANQDRLSGLVDETLSSVLGEGGTEEAQGGAPQEGARAPVERRARRTQQDVVTGRQAAAAATIASHAGQAKASGVAEASVVTEAMLQASDDEANPAVEPQQGQGQQQQEQQQQQQQRQQQQQGQQGQGQQEQQQEQQQYEPPPVPVVDGMWVLAVFGGQAIQEQELAFAKPPKGARKVILATNIAETSITIDDVVYVVDGGRSKQIDYDPLSGLQLLSRGWISKASAQQRMGRAGRVRPGVCFRLYPKPFFERHVRPHDTPELQRVPLDGLCLQVLHLGLGDPAAFLARAMAPPDPQAVTNAMQLLEDLGAVLPPGAGGPDKSISSSRAVYLASTSATPTAWDTYVHQLVAGSRGKASQGAGWQLTSLGMCLAQLPLEPRMGKMLVVASILGVLDPMLTLAAALSGKQPWLRTKGPQDAQLLQEVKGDMSFAYNPGNTLAEERSDFLALAAAFKDYHNKPPYEATYSMLNFKDLKELAKVREQLTELLFDIGLISAPGSVVEKHVQEHKLAKARQVLVEQEKERYRRRSREFITNRSSDKGYYLDQGKGPGRLQDPYVDQFSYRDNSQGGYLDDWDITRPSQINPQARLLSPKAIAAQAANVVLTAAQARKVTQQAALAYHTYYPGDTLLIKAVLVTGLFPQVAQVAVAKRETSNKFMSFVRQRQAPFGMKPSSTPGEWTAVGDHTYEPCVLTQEGVAYVGGSSAVAPALASFGLAEMHTVWLQERWLLYAQKVKFSAGILSLDTLAPVDEMTLMLFGSPLCLVDSSGRLHRATSSTLEALAGKEESGHVALALPAIHACVRLPAEQAAAVVKLRAAYEAILQIKLREPQQDVQLLTLPLCWRLHMAMADGQRMAYFTRKALQQGAPKAEANRLEDDRVKALKQLIGRKLEREKVEREGAMARAGSSVTSGTKEEEEEDVEEGEAEGQVEQQGMVHQKLSRKEKKDREKEKSLKLQARRQKPKRR